MTTNGLVSGYHKITESDPQVTIQGSDYFGHGLASLGDLDGDGVTDLAVGEAFWDDGNTNEGRLHFLMMNADGSVKRQIQHDADDFPGIANFGASAHVGTEIDALGDIDGDGVVDIAVGAAGDESVSILMLNSDGSLKAGYELNDSTSSADLAGAPEFGYGVAAAGDRNKDGVPDLLASAQYDDDGGTNRGAAYVFYLSGDGSEIGFAKFSDTQ